VALVEEKSKYFKKLLTLLNRSQNHVRKVRVAEVYGNNKKNSYDIMKTDIFICTIEKANQIINDMICKHLIKSHLGSVVIDEFHMIGDSFQGHILESIISKLLWIKADQTLQSKIGIQIIAMSATVSNVNLLSKYLNSVYFWTDFRPIPLEERIIQSDQIYDKSGKRIGQIDVKKSDGSAILYLVKQSIDQNLQTIIFCGSRWSCNSTIKRVRDHLFTSKISSISDINIISQRKNLVESLKKGPESAFLGTLVDEDLVSLVEYGLAFHHAGL
jgi:DNA polymerase theta